MTERKQPKIRFTGLHSHSGMSVGDGLGLPSQHLDFAYQNGLDAFALTDHGTGAGISYLVLHAKKMAKEGKNIKTIYGCEMYFHPDIEQWRKDKENIEKTTKAKKDDEEISGAFVEDEEETKKSKKSILNKRSHLVLLAQNQQGLNNLYKLISMSYNNENYYRFPRIDYKMLKQYNEGIIASSACMGGVLSTDYWENREAGADAVLNAMRETTRKMVDIFGDRWYGELQWNGLPIQHEINKYVIQVCDEFGVKLISTADSHYPTPDAWKDREIYKRISYMSSGRQIDTNLPNSIDDMEYELYPKNGDQMWEAYKKYSAKCGVQYDDELVLKSLEETYHIAHNRIETFFPDNQVRLPDFLLPEGKTAETTLDDLAENALRDMKKWSNKEYHDRLLRELKVIKDRGFAKYFVTMKAISDRANKSYFTGPGRGSAAGSLVAYVLGITQVDPIKYKLQFERFLSSTATDYPDIDYDVSDAMGLKQNLIDEWGENRVVPITNWNTLQLRSLIKDIGKFYGVDFQEVNAVTSKMLLEATPQAKAEHGITAGIYNPTFDEVMKYSKTLQDFLDKYPNIKTHVNQLYGSIRSASRHAGGIVVGENLDEWMPLINSKGVRQTPWAEGQNVRHLEPMGFIKFDVLGLETLSTMEKAVFHILRRHKGVKNPTFEDVKSFYNEHLHPDVLDMNDGEVYKNVFHNGSFPGIFQFTEVGAQSFCQRVKPNNIVDISSITSIFRPGPLSAGVDKSFAESKNDPDSVIYEHELIKEATQETYGYLVFQEQIALLAHKLGRDISLDEGNSLRKVLTKKGTGKEAEVKDRLHEKFINGCVDKGLGKQVGEKLWQKFIYFSGYGFNKSHAVCYSIISYQCAWLYNYYPSEWLAAYLDSQPETKKEKAVNIVKAAGYIVQGVDINKSGKVWEISEDGKTLIQPLSAIKGVGDAAIKEILDHRPFKTIEDFLFHPRVSYSKLNKKNIDALCRSEALVSLMDSRFTGGKHFWSAIAVDRPRKPESLIENIKTYAPEGDFTRDEKILNTLELTGVYPINMIVSEEVQRKLEEKMIPPLGSFDPDLGFCWFIPKSIEKKKTKKGKDFLIVEAIDDTNIVTKIKCWGYDPKKDALHVNRPYVAKLDFQEDWGFSSKSIGKNFKLIG
jgi:DNA polymerase-3 subunit alpha